MKMNEKDRERLNEFFDSFFEFLDSHTENEVYNEKPRYDPRRYIEFLDGRVVPAITEGVFVLDEEFKPFVTLTASKYMKMMRENAGNQLFGFAERSLYEYITTWCFLYISPEVKDKHKKRLKALILTGHYKYIENENGNLKRYLARKQKYLSVPDVEKIQTIDNVKDFFDYQWRVAVGITASYDEKISHSFLKSKDIDFDRIKGHQSMRIHSNPLSINETVENTDMEVRHLILLSYYARQILDYFRTLDRDGYTKAVYKYDKFKKNNKVTPS